jgi:hypothetical protein
MRFGPKAIIMSRSVKNMFYAQLPKKPSNPCLCVPEVSDLFFFFLLEDYVLSETFFFEKEKLRKITRSKNVPSSRKFSCKTKPKKVRQKLT